MSVRTVAIQHGKVALVTCGDALSPEVFEYWASCVGAENVHVLPGHVRAEIGDRWIADRKRCVPPLPERVRMIARTRTHRWAYVRLAIAAVVIAAVAAWFASVAQ